MRQPTNEPRQPFGFPFLTNPKESFIPTFWLKLNIDPNIPPFLAIPLMLGPSSWESRSTTHLLSGWPQKSNHTSYLPNSKRPHFSGPKSGTSIGPVLVHPSSLPFFPQKNKVQELQKWDKPRLHGAKGSSGPFSKISSGRSGRKAEKTSWR